MKPGPEKGRVFQSDSFGRYYIVGWLVVLVLVLGVLLMPQQRPKGSDDSYWAGYVTGYALGLLIMASGVAWLILRATHYQLHLDEQGLELRQGLAKTQRLAWADLKSWDFSYNRGFILHKLQGGKLLVPAFFNDTQRLINELQNHRPHAEWAALPQGQGIRLEGSKAGRAGVFGLGLLLIMVFGLGAWQSSWALSAALFIIISPLFAWLVYLHANHLNRLEFSPQGLLLSYPFRRENLPPEFLLNARFMGAETQPLPVARLADGRKLPLRHLKPGALSSVGLLNRIVESLPAPAGLDWGAGWQAIHDELKKARGRRNRLMNQNELDPPPWMTNPGSHPLGKFYSLQVGLLLRGRLHWGLALDPNPILLQEGKADAPLRLAYQPESDGMGSRDPRWLGAMAERAERRAGESEAPFQMAQAMGHRHEWPLDTLKSLWFPILVLDEAPEWCRILPHKYWPPQWQQAWIKGISPK